MLELEAIDMAGRILNLMLHGAAKCNEQGEIIGLTCVVIDCSAHSSAVEKFHAIADYSLNRESCFGLDGKYLWVNSAAECIKAYSSEEVLTLPNFISVLIAPEDRALVDSRLQGALHGVDEGKDSDLKIQCLRKDGSRLWLEVLWQPIFNGMRNPLGLRAIQRDITNRINAEHTAFQKASLMKAILESPNGMAIFPFDREYRYTDVLTELALQEKNKLAPIFMDLQMPVMDATRQIRSREALTANASTSVRNDCFIAGMNHSSRPFNTRSLAEELVVRN